MSHFKCTGTKGVTDGKLSSRKPQVANHRTITLFFHPLSIFDTSKGSTGITVWSPILSRIIPNKYNEGKLVMEVFYKLKE